MNFEPMIKSRFERFKEVFDLGNEIDSDNFEKFANYTIIGSHQPDIFGSDRDLLLGFCCGGGNDLSLDGVAIGINGLFVDSVDQAKDLVSKFPRINIELIFIQSKMRDSFESNEFVKFSNGIRCFLSESLSQPVNPKVRRFLDIKNYLLSDDVLSSWDSNPSIRAYFVSLGKYDPNNLHLIGHKNTFEEDIESLRTYGKPIVNFIDAERLKEIYDGNENVFKATIGILDLMPLTEVEGVDDSCVALCAAQELVELLTTPEGVIRKALFDDNVRDYQGSNAVNDEINQTIINEPGKFGLLNNGVTIVCEEYLQNNRKINLVNPQIVNGCQTSHVLFLAKRHGFDVSNVQINLKIIATKNLDIVNQIVRGTNRQNIVYDEAFEATKRFHKQLEEFFKEYSWGGDKIYYERRSRQYQHDPRIKSLQKVNLRVLTQSFISIFLSEPHKAHRHEIKLIQDFSDVIYREFHSKLVYFTAAAIVVEAEKIFRSRASDMAGLQSYKPHILFIFRHKFFGRAPILSHEKHVDQYCDSILSFLLSSDRFSKAIDESIDLFRKASEGWVKAGKSLDGRKDRPDFTDFLFRFLDGDSYSASSKDVASDLNFGRVRKVIIDRCGDNCGFISSGRYDYFFHSRSCPGLDFHELTGKMVSFDVEEDKNGRCRARLVRVVKEIS